MGKNCFPIWWELEMLNWFQIQFGNWKSFEVEEFDYLKPSIIWFDLIEQSSTLFKALKSCLKIIFGNIFVQIMDENQL